MKSGINAKKMAAEKLTGVQAIQHSVPDKIAHMILEEVLIDCIFLKLNISSANAKKLS